MKFPTLHQPARGYRYGIDSSLLMRFARLDRKDHVCDLGAGVGILGLIALEYAHVSKVVAIEVQSEFAEMAKKNAGLMHFSDRFELFNINWKNVRDHLKPRRFDVVVSNPPYRKFKTGRMPPQQQKAIAKHEIEGTLTDLIQAVDYLLKPAGRFYVLYPPLRLEELIVELAKVHMKIQRLAFIHSYAEWDAKLFMAEIVKSSPRELHVEPPVIIYQDPDHYRPEIEAWVGKKKQTDL